MLNELRYFNNFLLNPKETILQEFILALYHLMIMQRYKK